MNSEMLNRLRVAGSLMAVSMMTMGVAPVAEAVATYGAEATVEMELIDVTDLDGFSVPAEMGFGSPAWMVDVYPITAVDDKDVEGDAEASSSNTQSDLYTMYRGDMVEFGAVSKGSAGPGAALVESWAYNEFEIYIENLSDQTLAFEFDYFYSAYAEVTPGNADEDATGNAYADVYDNIGNGIYQEAWARDVDPTSGASNTGSFYFELGPSESNFFMGRVDTQGEAEASGSPAPVPVPAAVWLFGSGLLGLMVARRRF